MRPVTPAERHETERRAADVKAASRPRRRRDPAPSRFAYRYNRWMLSPFVRMFLRRGIPLLALVAVVFAWLGNADRREMLVGEVRAVWDQVQERPEFMVNLMAVDGASPALDAEIRKVAGLDLPMSSFDLSLEDLRIKLAALRSVKQVHLRIRPAGILQVEVVQRQPVLVWRRATGLELLDVDGISIADIASRSAYPGLPLIAGEGVQPHVHEALRVLAAAQPLDGRVRGLVRVGERRWDLVLDRDQKILLPARNPVAALDQVIHLHEEDALLAYDVTRIDMRLPQRPTLQRGAATLPENGMLSKNDPEGIPVSDGG